MSIKIDHEGLKLARQEAGMTQVDAAMYFDVSLTTYIMWERGVTKPNELRRKKVQNFIDKHAS